MPELPQAAARAPGLPDRKHTQTARPNLKCRIPNRKFRIPNFRYRISNSEFEISNSEFEISNSEFQIPNLKFRIPNLTFQIPNSRGSILGVVCFGPILGLVWGCLKTVWACISLILTWPARHICNPLYVYLGFLCFWCYTRRVKCLNVDLVPRAARKLRDGDELFAIGELHTCVHRGLFTSSPRNISRYCWVRAWMRHGATRGANSNLHTC